VKRSVKANVVWELADDFEPILARVLASAGHVVKESRAKLVTRHEWEGRIYYVKRYRHNAFPLRPFKFYFKLSQARLEWHLAKQLNSRGIPIVRHVAIGVHWSLTGLQESILITEGFEGAPADEAPGLNAEALVAFIERIAKAGIVQDDLHPANLLVRSDPLEIRLVDLHGTRVLENASESERERNRDRMLALLRMSLPIPVSRHVELLSRELRKRALFERSRRCLKTNREFSVQRFGAWRWNVRTSSVTPAVQAVLAAPDKFIDEARALKRGKSSTVAARDGLVLKRYNFKKPLNLLKDLFRGSRGRRGFRKAYHLELCGTPTARGVATADRRVCGVPVRSYVLMEEIPNAIDAGQWNGDPRHAAQMLGTLLADLHNDGFTHRDLKETNLLFDANGVPHLIDLDGLNFVFDVTPDEAAANLQRLAKGLRANGKFTRSNAIAFMLTYCRARELRPRQLFPRPGSKQ
jgi:tRNA A-37 threonylcarbamoyl transferase component Bud32